MQSQSDEEYAKALQAQFNLENQYNSTAPPTIPISPTQYSLDTVLSAVVDMPRDRTAMTLADQYGLSILNVTWEDNARDKNSVWGPCISDMTLNVQGKNLPVIRSPNYEDITWDVPMENVPLLVGNEHGEVMFDTNLREYLDNFRDYLHDPSSWNGSGRSLLREDDSHVIMSSQACFLPIHAEGGETAFNVSIFNYQTRKDDPAILTIVASANGTSAQIVDSHGSQKLYFNQNGEKCSFVGKRLSQYRVEEGRENDGSEMTSKEKEQNMLLIIQVPLKQKVSNYRDQFTAESLEDSFLMCAPMSSNVSLRSRTVDVEDAILSVGESEGVFREVGNISIERDERYPVRVTLQYYKATSNGAVDEDVMSQIYAQLVESRSFGENTGSLVVGGNTDRPTEWTNDQKLYGGYSLPIWWDEFWLMYGNIFSQYTKIEAADLVFKNGRFCQSSLSQSKEKILNILGSNASPEPLPVFPPVSHFNFTKLD